MGNLRRVLTVALAASLAFSAAPVLAYAVEFPNSMAAVGDSISRAANVGPCCLGDNPRFSWSTGDDSQVNSHYQRILASNPNIAGHAFNDSVSGAKMANLDAQVKVAAGQQVEYLTILMGANDICTPKISDMTPVDVFTNQFRQALTDFTAADPTANILVSSIPNIYQLWAVLHTNPLARFVWSAFQVCQSMLAEGNTEADRQMVLAREMADNDALALVCAEFPRCLWDAYATFGFAFTAGDASTLDYFHPSLTGQNDIADVTWGASYWPI